MRNIQVAESQKKIVNLRKYYGTLIHANDSRMEEKDNPFIFGSSEQEVSLSCYNKPTSFQRPVTAKNQPHFLSGIKGLDPNPPDENEFDMKGIADLQDIKDGSMLTRSVTEAVRLTNMQEVLSIKDSLSKAGVYTNNKILQRAVMMPEEIEMKPGENRYPTPAMGLM